MPPKQRRAFRFDTSGYWCYSGDVGVEDQTKGETKMSVTSYDEVSSSVHEQLLNEQTALKYKIRNLEYDNRQRLDKDLVRRQVIELAERLTGNDPSDLDSEQLDHVNEILEQLSLATLKREFKVKLTVMLSAEVEIDVEAASLDAAKQAVELGNYEDEIRRELDVTEMEIEEYKDIEES
jgi:hypothetical protein